MRPKLQLEIKCERGNMMVRTVHIDDSLRGKGHLAECDGFTVTWPEDDGPSMVEASGCSSSGMAKCIASRNGEVFLPQDVLRATAIEILRLAAGVERLKKVADQAIELAGAKIDPHDPNWIDTNSVGDFTDHKPELAAYLQEREGS